MGLLQTIRDSLALPALAAGSVAYESPWASPNHLLSIDPPDRPYIPATRQTAIGIPALARARRLIVGSIARCPLYQTTGDEVDAMQPDWLSRSNGPISPFHRMLWTVDDLLFYGWSLWALERDQDGRVIAADRVPFADWEFTTEGGITYQSREVNPESVCLIPGVDEGLLAASPETIRHAVALNRASTKAATTPVAHTELHQTGGDPLSDEAKRALITGWIKARQSEDGAVSYTSPNIEVKNHGSYDGSLLIEGRAANAIDIARITGIPAILLDAASGDNTMRYSNVDARNTEFIDFCLAPFMAAIAARLGMDDMTAPGAQIRFDTRELTDVGGVNTQSVDAPDDERKADNEELAHPGTR